VARYLLARAPSVSRSLPTVVVQALYAQTTSSVFLVLLTASHSLFSTIRVVNNTQAVTSNGDVFQPFPFSVVLPPDEEDLQVRAQLQLYDVQQEILDNLRLVAGARERVVVSLKVIEAATPDTVLQSVSGLNVENVQYNAESTQLDLSIDNFLTESYPRDSFSPATFPAIF